MGCWPSAAEPRSATESPWREPAIKSRIVAALFLVVVYPEPLPGQGAGTTLRPTDVFVVIRKDTHYDGSYRASGISRVILPI